MADNIIVEGGGNTAADPELYAEQEAQRKMQQRMLDEVRANEERRIYNEQRARQMWEDKQLMDAAIQQAQQASAVDDQLKNIQQVRRFIATRRFQNDLESGTPLHQAMARNLSAFTTTSGSVPSSMVNAFRSALPTPPVNLGEVSVLRHPVTGAEVGLATRTGEKSVSAHFPTTTRETDPSVIQKRDFERRKAMLDATEAQVARLTKRLESVDEMDDPRLQNELVGMRKRAADLYTELYGAYTNAPPTALPPGAPLPPAPGSAAAATMPAPAAPPTAEPKLRKVNGVWTQVK